MSIGRAENEVNSVVLHLELGEWRCNFNFEKSVCNHGFFMMPPNVWIPSTKTLQRPLRLADCSGSVLTSISHPDDQTFILIRVHNTQHLSTEDQQAIMSQVGRMLRLSKKDDNDVKEFHRMHPTAENKSFGRLFRSPDIFEDMVKCLLLCNCRWKRTLNMAQALCKLKFESKGRKRKRVAKKKSMDEVESVGNFPTWRELITLDEGTLKSGCNLGYRAGCIYRLAKSVDKGEVKLNKFEEGVDERSIHQICNTMEKLQGFGPFVRANVLMCIGYYGEIPIDTETIRHIQKSRGKEIKVIEDVVKEMYDKYAPFQCLAFWLEMTDYYESKRGKLSELAASEYHTVTSSLI